MVSAFSTTTPFYSHSPTSSTTTQRRRRNIIVKGETKNNDLAFGRNRKTRVPTSLPAATSDDDGAKKKKKQKKATRKAKTKRSPSAATTFAKLEAEEKEKKKKEIMEKLKAKLEEKKRQDEEENGSSRSSPNNSKNLLKNLNPFAAGQNLRKTLGDLTTLGKGISSETKQKYYLDDRFLEQGGIMTERNPFLERFEKDNYIPEVLVIGATGEVGRLVVRRLLLEGKFRVRVLVRDLYSQTLNLLGTGVTYCQGDLGNMESLEYALTDVDKIVFCANAPRPDEQDFQDKFEYFVKENLEKTSIIEIEKDEDDEIDDMEWEQLDSILELRAQLAEQVDYIGMQNLVTAYQNVRHADYGTSQAAKRSLFKFSSRPEDFQLFAIDDEDPDDFGDDENMNSYLVGADEYDYEDEDDDDEEYMDDDDDYEAYYDDYDDIEERGSDVATRAQVQWIVSTMSFDVFVCEIAEAIANHS